MTSFSFRCLSLSDWCVLLPPFRIAPVPYLPFHWTYPWLHRRSPWVPRKESKGSVREQTTRSFLLRLLVFVVVVVVVAAVSVRKRVEGGGRASSSLPDLRPAAPRF
ncbi:hypothetical protein B296_00010289 [Ensete ventricosum]|uniref:Transmembrane protein n=1 Tax=Ensete ventricosum TaxID=4639 RepID=A0A427ABN1_ENSVE|nr:hypothetical protein B296_00010289 [Ensete ventricosum]